MNNTIETHIARLVEIGKTLEQLGHYGLATEMSNTCRLIRMLDNDRRGAEQLVTHIHERYADYTAPFTAFCSRPAGPPRGEM
jgi:hypothetical protein